MLRTEMRKGSPEGYNTENGYSQPARKPQTGEPNERQPLYRIRCTQEKYQLLREDRRRNHRGRRHAASDAPGVGGEATGAVARRDGSNAVQRMDLRYVETLRCRVANGTSGDDEGDRRIQEEERQAGRAENRGPGALQSVAHMLRGAEGNPRAAADAALPQPSGGAGGAHEEQDERAAHGGGSRVQQTAAAREGILPRIAGHHRGSAGIGERSVAPESRSAGDVSDDAVAIAGPAAETAATGQARDGADEHSRSGRSDGSHLGAGSGRPAAIPLGGGCGELLRADFGVGLIGRPTKARADLETAQRALANSAGGGGEAGAAVEPAIGSDPRARGPARTPQSGDPGGGTQTGGLSVSRGQIRKTIRNPHDSGNRRAACTGGGGGVKHPNPGFTVGPPFPARSIIGNLSRRSRVRYAAPNYGAPLTPASDSQEQSLRRGKGGLWDIGSQSCPTAQRFVSDPPAVPRFVGTARRNFSSRCAIKTVSRPAGSLKFNLRGRRYAVPANGCLVTLMRWPNLQRIQFGKSVQTVNPATVASPEILPISPRRCVFSLDKSLSWMSFGLAGMRERAALLGGTLVVQNVPGKRVGVTLEIPRGSGNGNGSTTGKN